MRHIRTILVANRGEIACRILRTAQILGLHTIAVYAPPDARARHVRMADEAWPVEGDTPTGAYLNMDQILDIAQRSGADAIHPGYGFLSENAEFAKRVTAAGIRFIGPTADAIKKMGDKSEAKAVMARAGVPLVPGYHGDDQSDEALEAAASKIGFPLLIKASAGGGGKGMKVVDDANNFLEALHSARREALKSFGHDRVLLEKYLPVARHVEVQILCDTQGQALYLGDRDCSVQRRHQKILEEAPAPGLPDEIRHAMGEAAVRCARAIGYVNAGTVEFLFSASGDFYFMEVNTRLQVEHPVTELTTGLDLVEWQIRIADEQPLSITQESIRLQGHAIEARVCAEQPESDFLPSTGKLTRVRWPDDTDGLRIDHAISEGDTITRWFDPMLAKIIVHAPSRDAAIRKLYIALAHTLIEGVHTNLAYLCELLASKPFRTPTLHTRLTETCPPGSVSHAEIAIPVAAMALLDHGRQQLPKPLRQYAYRTTGPVFESFLSVQHANHPVQIQAQISHHQACIRWEDKTVTCDIDWGDEANALRIRDTAQGPWQSVQYRVSESELIVLSPVLARYTLSPSDHWEAENTTTHQDTTAPMSGTVVKILAAPGRRIPAGDTVIIIEAMKMEHSVRIARAGIVDEILVREGDTVKEGQSLYTYSVPEDGSAE